MSLDPRTDRLQELFARALELDEAARTALLADLAAGDERLSAELRRLLAAATGEWEVDRSPWREISSGSAGDAPPPERVGPYRIVRELGRGGMGRVFLAEQESEDFRRAVAVKIIDAPRSDEESVRRFRTEVRILAALDHPGIARFLSGGRSPEGIWHLALEYVEGEDLIRYADRRALDVRARIGIFLQVLDAVAFAHRRGVIHRDLKPANLLVGADGRTRLLDFGISKLVEPGGAAAATLTRTGLRALTPAYASPEQFRGEGASPASDVFSLGVVLYELLAGRRPFDGGSEAALAHAVLESDPESPSTAARLRSPTGGDGAADRDPGRRGPGPDRDLDAICLKALRKAPADRYRSVEAMAEDLRRHLDGRPVEARRGSRRYRLGRLARRHRGRLAVAGAAAVAIAGLVAALLAHREAERLRPPETPVPRPFPFARVTERPIADLEREFAAAPGSLEAGAALAIGLRYADRIDDAALVLERMRRIPGKENDPLCDYVDGVIAQQRDQPQRALVLYTRARDGALAAGRGEILGKVRASRGRILVVLGERESGEREMELALADFERAGDSLSAAQVLNNLAIESLQRADYVRGEERLERALARFRESGATGAIVLRNLAELGVRRGRPDLAEKWARESLELAEADGRERQGRRIWVLAEALLEAGRPDEAAPLLDEAVGYLRAQDDEPDLANALYVRGRLDVAAARFDRIAETVAEIEGTARDSGARASLTAVRLLRGYEAAARGESAIARRELAEGRRLQIAESEPVLAASTDVDRALLEVEAGDLDAASRILDDPSNEAGIGSSAEVLAETVRARIDAEAGRIEAARARFAKLGDGDAASPSLRRKLVFLRARAAFAIAEARVEDARRDLLAAAEEARSGGRRVEELSLRLDLAELDGEAGRAERRALAGEARKLGLEGLARRGD